MSKTLIKQVTKQQLTEIVQSYHQFFPGWDIVPAERLIRRNGPILQQIGFEALRSGTYRPSSSVRVLIAPNVAVLHSFLDIHHREILPSQHEARRHAVVTAMEHQFRPPIREPLDYRDVLGFCESDKPAGFNDFCALAALNAYGGNDERASQCTQAVKNLSSSLGRPLAAWEAEYVRYAAELEGAIRDRRVSEFLASFL